MKLTPCKDCKDRKVGCHAVCQKYISWQNERKELQKKQQKENVYIKSSMYSLGDVNLSYKHFSSKRTDR